MKTNIQDTSLEAYECLVPILGNKQQVILRVILESEPITNKEIAKELGLPINEVTGRVFELREKGILEDKGKVKCKFTGRPVHQWGTIKKQLEMF